MTDKQKQRPANNVYKIGETVVTRLLARIILFVLNRKFGTSKSPTFHILTVINFLNDNANRYRQTNEFT